MAFTDQDLQPPQPPPDAPPNIVQAAQQSNVAPGGIEHTAAPPAPDPLDQIKQSLTQQYQQNLPRPASGGVVKRLLQNFIGGMGDSMMQHAGLPTPYQQSQKALAELQGVTTAQSNLELHKMIASQYGTQPVQLPDGSVINVMNKDVANLQGKLASAAATQTAAQTKTINVPGVGAFAWNADQGKYMPVEGAQLPPHILEPGEAKVLGLPEGTTQVPAQIYKQLVSAKVSPIAYQQGASGPYEENKLFGTQRSLGIGNPRAMMVQARQYPVLDTFNGNAPSFANPFQITQNPGRFIPQQSGQTALNKTSLLEDIRGNVQNTRSALQNLGEDFSPTFKAQLAIALRSTDPRSAISSLLNSAAAGSLNDKQQNAVIALTNLIENAMAMRSMLGAGQGSDELRSAIQAVIPGPKTPSASYGLKQLDAFENTLNRLGRGIPNVPLRPLPTVQFHEGSDTYNIPADRVAAFKQKHPQAVPSGR